MLEARLRKGLRPPFRAGRVLPATPEEADKILEQAPNPAWPLADHGLDLARQNAAVSGLVEADAEHHVADHKTPTWAKHTPGLAQRAMLVAVAQVMEAVVGDHYVH